MHWRRTPEFRVEILEDFEKTRTVMVNLYAWRTKHKRNLSDLKIKGGLLRRKNEFFNR